MPKDNRSDSINRNRYRRNSARIHQTNWNKYYETTIKQSRRHFHHLTTSKLSALLLDIRRR